MNMYCQTKRLLLQVLPPYYSQQVCQFYEENREHIEPWEAERDIQFYTTNYHRAMLEAEYNEIIRSKMLRYYVFLQEDPEKIIGSVCANNIRYGAFENCNVGYKIHKDYVKCGYGKEAVEKLLSVLFTEYKLHRVEAMVHPENEASIALLETLGFEREGISKEAAKLPRGWCDMYRYGLITGQESKGE